jgi:hypothetical protein
LSTTSYSPEIFVAIRNRFTGEIIASEPYPEAEFPFLLPPSDTLIWHYLKFEHFENLVHTAQLHLGRLDKQSDETDGMYSKENFVTWSPTMAALMRKMGSPQPPEHLQETNELLRKRAFIHCWSIRDTESSWMWRIFLQGNARSVVIRSTVKHLQKSLSGQRVTFARLPYFSESQPRLDFSYTAPFLAKHEKFSGERELRVLYQDNSEAEFKQLPVRADTLIRKVTTHPGCSREFVWAVRSLLSKHGISADVSPSGLTLG